MNFSFENIVLKGVFGILAEQTGPLIFLGFLLSVIAGYLLGSLNTALVVSKVFYGEDIRKSGSGNAGMTNMMRTYGTSAAVFTLVGDALKAIIAVIIGTVLGGREMGAYIAGLFCVVGHALPLYFGFKGGKGIVVTAAMLLCLHPLCFLLLFILFVLIVLVTRYISLGSIICVLAFPVMLSRMSEPNIVSTLCSIAIAGFVVWLHRGNIMRLYNKTESKFEFKKSKKKKDIQKESEAEAVAAAKTDNEETEDK